MLNTQHWIYTIYKPVKYAKNNTLAINDIKILIYAIHTALDIYTMYIYRL